MAGENNEKISIGLTGQQVADKQAAGLVNGDYNVKTKSYGRIISDNIFSLFNLVNVILLIAILSVGSYKNALFFFVVIWNFALGVIQEVRAKKTIDKLSLLTAPKATVLRDGAFQTIEVKDIVLGEIMQLKNGNQVCADCVILKGQCQVNESLITGESEPVFKGEGDELRSGSFLVSGNARAECIHIGTDNYVNKITLGAKYFKKSNSIIMNSVKNVVKIIAIVLVPFAALIIWKNFFALEQSFTEGMIATVASLSAMIPGGLVLLVSMVMAVSVIRLSTHNTLAQDLYCVENLARVDVICMDKTGTLTEGRMAVEEIIKEDGFDEELIRRYAAVIDDENSTITAVREFLALTDEERGCYSEAAKDASLFPFSSGNKWSAVYFPGRGSVIMGAPEFVSPEGCREKNETISAYVEAAKRVVMFATSPDKPEQTKNGFVLPGSISPIGYAVIADKVKENAKSTIDYFEAQGVKLKVISGDNALTASQIARQAGLDGADRYIDAAGLDTYEKISDALKTHSVFGRVSPQQKLDIMKALKEQGHTVAMVGDGANDVLALRAADCSIAMQAGSDAARNVADIVLLDSDFSSMPLILSEGRKSINNLQRSAGLYLTKTVYAFILTIIFLFVTFPYPFQSIQVTLVGVVTIGMPSFFLALEPNNNRIREHFLKNVFNMSLPSGILTAMGIMASVLISKFAMGATLEQVQTIATFVTILLGFIVIIDICGKLNKWKFILLGWLTFVAAGCALLFPKMFDIVALPFKMWLLIIAVATVFFVIHCIWFRVILPKQER